MDPLASLSDKILPRDELLARRERARREGRSVVQCHGCFDIVHPGHVRHLQHAARQGDVLLVSLTADAAMRKGAGRPLFPQELRAENLAALDFVDWVHVEPGETAVDLLGAVRPDVYVKGREYESNDDPRFREERDVVERHGGRVLFSSGDIVFSSTALIAAMEHQADPFHARLRRLVDSGEASLDRLGPAIDGARGRRVCVLGETIVDTYVLCDRPDVASEGPIMSLRPLERSSYDGGAAIVARHLAAMGARPTLVTALPQTTEGRALAARLEDEGVEVRSVPVPGPLMEKQRFLVGEQKVVKVDLVEPLSLDETERDALVGLAADAASTCDGAVLADFGRGFFTPRLLSGVIDTLRGAVELIAGDVSGPRNGLLRMRGLDLVCPTEHELRAAMGDFDSSLNAVVWRCLEETEVGAAIVTLGADGLIAFDRLPGAEREEGWAARVRGEHVPALAPHAVDTLGCGDALLAAAFLASLSGASLTGASVLGAVAAGAQAARRGNAVVSAIDLRRGLARLAGAGLAVAPVTTAAPGTPGTPGTTPGTPRPPRLAV